MNLSIQRDIPLKEKNWFKTGGSAQYYCEPRTSCEFQEALEYARENHLEIFVLGDGANILVSDEGFKGLVIHPQVKDITFIDSEDGCFLTAGAGIKIEDLITYCLNNNISGLEEFSGIPGTVGGSTYINLHYYQFLLSHFLVKATIIHKKTGELQEVDNAWFNFGYNQSTLMNDEHYVVNVTFKLKRISDLEVAYARGRSVEIIRHRVSRYPSKNTCGSFFRNFHNDEVTLVSNGKKVIWVAYYLDKIGVKGALKVGGAIVSHQHANMLVTNDTATSADIVNLARTMQEMVQKEFGILPKTECLMVGFKEYPLHT
jgi:UDP-N-acetylmuramate dehydrogenase